jgi:hypothetical protein
MPVGWAIVVVVQWLAIIALTVVVLGVLRQVAPRLERAAAPPVRDLRNQGPAVGSKLPGFTARDGSGESVGGAAVLRGRPGVLLFLSASCGPCLTLATELGGLDPAAGLAGVLTVVSDPEGAGTLPFPAWLRVLTVPDGQALDILNVHARPFAIAVGADGAVQAKRMLNKMAQLAELAAAVRPRADVSSDVPCGTPRPA